MSPALIFLALLTLVSAAPPACLLACVAREHRKQTTCSTLNQVGCICRTLSPQIVACLHEICPVDTDKAVRHFSETCPNFPLTPTPTEDVPTTTPTVSREELMIRETETHAASHASHATTSTTSLAAVTVTTYVETTETLAAERFTPRIIATTPSAASSSAANTLVSPVYLLFCVIIVIYK
ncbi:hypothetical protein CJU89_4263 [Yarrowia sp. B02]|nr:hypothetical protein CJU89_4263 [Yarrowia sp. B02]